MKKPERFFQSILYKGCAESMKQFVLDMMMFSMVPVKEYEFSRLDK